MSIIYTIWSINNANKCKVEMALREGERVSKCTMNISFFYHIADKNLNVIGFNMVSLNIAYNPCQTQFVHIIIIWWCEHNCQTSLRT